MKLIISLLISLVAINAHTEESCLSLKKCSSWVQSKTGDSYELNKYGDFKFKESKNLIKHNYHTDFVFSSLLNENGFSRIKTEDKKYQIVLLESLPDTKIPLVKRESIPMNFDIYSVEFSLTLVDDKETTKSILKKLLSKNGRIIEMKEATMVKVIDTGLHLNMISLAMKELGKNIIKNKDAFDL